MTESVASATGPVGSGASERSAHDSTQDTAPVLADEPADVEIIESRLLQHGKVWDIRRDRFRFGDAELVRDYVDHTGAVAIVALDEDDRVLLLQQYRHPIAQRDWEIPAGLMDLPGEPSLAAAERELAEEADLRAEDWGILVDLYLSPGGSSEAMRVFLARDLSRVDHDYARTEEEAEFVPVWVPLDEAIGAALAGRIGNAPTVSGLLAARAAKDRGWATLRDPATPWTQRDRVRGERSV